MAGKLSTRTELLGVEHFVYEQSLKNLIERMNEYIKDRTEAFENMQKSKI